jgi:hypothetical protein
VEGSSHGLIYDSIEAFAERDCGNPRKIFVYSVVRPRFERPEYKSETLLLERVHSISSVKRRNS